MANTPSRTFSSIREELEYLETHIEGLEDENSHLEDILNLKEERIVQLLDEIQAKDSLIQTLEGQ